MRRLFITAYLMLLLSCTPLSQHSWYTLPSPDQVESNNISIIVGNQDLAMGVLPWKSEVSRRYNDFILMIVHGVEFQGEWVGAPDCGQFHPITELVAEARAMYGEDRRVVLVVCNPSNIICDIPNVTYATDTVWVYPDSHTGVLMNSIRDADDDNIGSIFEFTENE